MKRILLYLVFLTMSLTASATGQEGDFIYIDGTQWEILGRPIKAEGNLYPQVLGLLPKERSVRSSNWEGYIAYWSFKGDALRLDSIQYDITNNETTKSDKMCVATESLRNVFEDYLDGEDIIATWYTGELHLATGKVIYAINNAYNRNYETEQFITIDHGKKTGEKVYNNKIAVEGVNLSEIKDFSSLKEKFPLPLKNYPELANARRIIFHIKDAHVDANGNLTDCDVEAFVMYTNKREDHPAIAKEMAKAMKAYHPWQVFLINGEYQGYGVANRTFPYLIKDTK